MSIEEFANIVWYQNKEELTSTALGIINEILNERKEELKKYADELKSNYEKSKKDFSIILKNLEKPWKEMERDYRQYKNRIPNNIKKKISRNKIIKNYEKLEKEREYLITHPRFMEHSETKEGKVLLDWLDEIWGERISSHMLNPPIEKTKIFIVSVMNLHKRILGEIKNK